MNDRSDPPNLADLDARLRALRQADSQASDGASPGGGGASMGGLGVAMRIGVELVSALGVGVGLGYLLDRWLGTKPWLMLVFFFLGAAAGVLNVWRAVNRQDVTVGFKPPARETDIPNEQGPDAGKRRR
ncbi:MAG: AtpZ/AtpI family protein [Rhodospirillales bacterium]|nr:AtpZ/AtpI family protein [Rhodospirillales bacterium]